MRGKITLTLLIAVAMAAPAATASWSAFGTQEPDTPYDESSGYMFTEPTTSGDPGVNNVYFNAIPNVYLTGTNANVGATGSRVATLGALHWQAMLGLWKDCNGDGYVGQAESAAVSYRAELLADATICPAGTIYNPEGTWVYEYVPIGNAADDGAEDPAWIINDTESAVWGDIGLPGAAPGTSCPIRPTPSGTTSSTGAAVRFVDCFVNGQVVGAINDVDGALGTGLGFEDPNNPQKSQSPLNQDLPISPFGNPYAGDNNDEWQTGILQEGGDGDEAETEDDSMFRVWDCSAEPLVVVPNPLPAELQSIPVEDPTGGELSDDGVLTYVNTSEEYTLVYAPSPTVHDDPTDSSLYLAMNHTAEGLESCEEGDPDGNNWGFVMGGNAGFVEGGHEGTAQSVGKDKSDLIFGFFESTEGLYNGENMLLGECEDLLFDGDGLCPFPEGDQLGFDNLPTSGVTHDAPNSLGLGGPVGGALNPGWSADTVFVTTGQTINRATLEPSDRQFWTFYASVGEITTAIGTLPSDNPGTYGAANCSTIGEGAGVELGWTCDPDKWYKDPAGNSLGTGPVPGDSYNLIDADCFDGSLAKGSGVYASAQYTKAADCETP